MIVTAGPPCKIYDYLVEAHLATKKEVPDLERFIG